MNKNIIATFVFLVFCFGSKAQESLIASANKLFDARSFSDAIPKYEKALKKDSNDAMVLAKLGECYRLTNNTSGVVRCYSKLAESGRAEMGQKLVLGQALMTLGRYEEAKKYLEE